MHPAPPTVKALTMLAVAAKDINDELTVILSAVEDSLALLQPWHPLYRPLAEIRDAAYRCGLKTRMMATWVDGQGVRVRGASTVEGLTR